ncbi:beta strand repeat-containing protein [Geminocystis sp. CENA526]|uniref:beta strand repeat-containing protein n=1 Tax=Geminocystis sp. CENA526 TaxID=1355871 RepID=UPI003D6EC5E5
MTIGTITPNTLSSIVVGTRTQVSSSTAIRVNDYVFKRTGGTDASPVYTQLLDSSNQPIRVATVALGATVNDPSTITFNGTLGTPISISDILLFSNNNSSTSGQRATAPLTIINTAPSNDSIQINDYVFIDNNGTLTLLVDVNSNPVRVQSLSGNTVTFSNPTVTSISSNTVLRFTTDIDGNNSLNNATINTTGTPVVVNDGIQNLDFVFIDNSGVLTPLLDANGQQIRASVSGGNITFVNGSNEPTATVTPLSDGQTLRFSTNSNGTGSINTTTINTRTTSSTSNVINVTNLDGGIVTGMEVSGVGIPSGTTVTGINLNNGTITLSNAVTLSNTTLTFTKALSGSVTLQGEYGTLVLNTATGGYTYTPYAGLTTGGVETFNYTMNDTAGATSSSVLTINVSVQTDPPTARPDTATITEGTASIGDINSNSYNVILGNVNGTSDPNRADSDRDSSDGANNTITVTGISFNGTDGTLSGGNYSVTGTYGTLTINANGNYTYVLKTDQATQDLINALNGSQSLTETFLYTITDSTNGQTAQTSLTINIQGVNDPPVARNDFGIAVEAGGVNNGTLGSNAIGNVLDNDTDVDHPESSLTVSQITFNSTTDNILDSNGEYSVDGLYGTLYVKPDGTYRYEVNNSNTTVNALPVGATLPDIFSYTVQDPQGGTGTATLTITIQGANDAPVNNWNNQPIDTNNIPSLSVNEAGSLNITGLSVNDPDDDGTNAIVPSELSTVTLTVSNGILNIGNLNGASFANSTSNDSNTITLSGTEQQINDALATLSYTPNLLFSGSDSLIISSSDGLGLNDTDVIAINVTPPNPTVNSFEVNEGSPWAVFQVTNLAINQSVSLDFDGTATVNEDYLSNYEYWNGTAWVPYNGGSIVVPNTLPDGSNNGNGSTNAILFIRVPLQNDPQFDNNETITLTVSNSSNVSGGIGTATIKDDGTGSIFESDTGLAKTGVQGFELDDDRPLTIEPITVTERVDTYAVFEVKGANDQWVKLALQDGTAITGGNQNLGLNDYSGLEYSIDGTNWTNYDPNSANGGYVQLNNTGSLFVRTTIIDDNVYEGSETFNLLATNTGNSTFTGTATIIDDEIFVSNVEVNEGSQWAVFTVFGAEGTNVALSIPSQDGSTVGQANTTSGFAIEYFVPNPDGTGTWTPYNSAVSIDDSGQLLVRVNISSEQDTNFEGAETFILTATNTVSNSSANGTGTIFDDGTGLKFLFPHEDITGYDPNTDPNYPNVVQGDFVVITDLSQYDDDRPLSVTPTQTSFTEGTDTHAIFEVKATSTGADWDNNPTQYVKLELGVTGDTATSGDDYSGLQYWNGTAWVDYTADSFVQIPAGGTSTPNPDGTNTVNPDNSTLDGKTLLVRTAIVNDTIPEPTETFTLTAFNTGNRDFSGVGTIVDNDGGVNNPPVVDLDTNNGGLNNSADYDGSGAVNFTQGDTNLSDADSDDLVNLKVSIDVGEIQAGDVLVVGGTSIDLTSTGTGSVTVNGVTFDYDVSDVGGERIITFTPQTGNSATLLEYEALIDALQYNSTGTATGSRDFSVTVEDENNAVSTPAIFTVNINTSPSLDLSPNNNTTVDNQDTFTEKDSNSALFTNTGNSIDLSGSSTVTSITVSIPESDILDGVNERFTINLPNGNVRNIPLNFTDGQVINQVNFSGVIYTITATVTGGTKTLTFTPANPVNQTQAENFLDAFGYRNNSLVPSPDDRNFTVQYFTENNGQSNLAIFTVEVQPVNDAPSFRDLDTLSANNFLVGGSPIVIDNDVIVFDPELRNANNWDGAIFTIERSSGANPDDVFGFSGNVNINGNDLRIGTLVVGTIVQNSSGTLNIQFNDQVTNGRINTIVRQLTYENVGTNPPNTVDLVYRLNDGNTGNQGIGGALNSDDSLHTITVNIISPAPTANPDTNSVAEDSVLTITANNGLLANDTGSGLRVNQFSLDVDGNGSIDPNTETFTVDPNSDNAVSNIKKIVNGVEVTVGALRIASDGSYTFTPAPDFNGTVPTINYTIIDGQGREATATLNLTVTPVNDRPIAKDIILADPRYTGFGTPKYYGLGGLFSTTNGNFDDSKDQVTGGSTANGLLGVAIVGNASNSSQGQWQYLAGRTWTNIPTTLNDGSALLLAPATNIRFLPNSGFTGTPGELTVRVIDNNTVNGSAFGTFTNGQIINNLSTRTTAGLGETSAISPPVTINTHGIINTPPVINNLDGKAFTTATNSSNLVINSLVNPSGSPATIVDQELLKAGGTLTVSLADSSFYFGGNTTGENIAIRFNSGVTLGANNTLSIEGTSIGTFSGGTNGTPLVINFTTELTQTQANTLIQNITYSTNQHEGMRKLSFIANDSLLNSNRAEVYINVSKNIWTPENSLIGDQSGQPRSDTITGTPKNDFINGRGANDALYGREGNDIIISESGTSILDGDVGNDTLIGSHDNDMMRGGADHDLLIGNGGNDQMNGGSGNDTLVGGTGADTLTGGSGKDYFVYPSAKDSLLNPNNPNSVTYDYIMDFNSTEGDKIVVQNDIIDVINYGTISSMNEVIDKLRDLGSNKAAVLTLSGSPTQHFLAINQSSNGFDAHNDTFIRINTINLTTNDFMTLNEFITSPQV